MRPVDKGVAPYEKIENYQDAEPFLNDRIGRYCSFCEFPIFHVPEVEHKEGKKSGGDLTKWENLLYGCKYCNTRKAQAIYEGVGLGHCPCKNGDKDKRWMKRIETLGVVQKCKESWLKMKESQFRKEELEQIITLAKQMGFFSVWMMVFEDESEVKRSLIENFPGTSKECFDLDGNPRRRLNGDL